MSRFTKGKWRYVEMNNTVVVDDDSYLPIAIPTGCSMFPEEEYKANGILIASAPEMYEQLKNLVKFVDAVVNNYSELQCSTRCLEMLIEKWALKNF